MATATVAATTTAAQAADRRREAILKEVGDGGGGGLIGQLQVRAARWSLGGGRRLRGCVIGLQVRTNAGRTHPSPFYAFKRRPVSVQRRLTRRWPPLPSPPQGHVNQRTGQTHPSLVPRQPLLCRHGTAGDRSCGSVAGRLRRLSDYSVRTPRFPGSLVLAANPPPPPGVCSAMYARCQMVTGLDAGGRPRRSMHRLHASTYLGSRGFSHAWCIAIASGLCCAERGGVESALDADGGVAEPVQYVAGGVPLRAERWRVGVEKANNREGESRARTPS